MQLDHLSYIVLLNVSRYESMETPSTMAEKLHSNEKALNLWLTPRPLLSL